METHSTDIRREDFDLGNGRITDPAVRDEQAQRRFWEALGVLYARRRFVAGVTLAGAIASVIIALLLPRWYAAEARVLQPEGSPLSLIGMMGSAGGGLSSLLGGGTSEYTRYLAILTSRTMMEDLVEEFDLVRVYNLEDSEAPMHEAVEKLRKNVEFDVNAEYLFLAVRAYDRDPERAAAMANFMVTSLNDEHARLSSQNARQSRLFIERRLHEAQVDLDSVRAALQAFQEEHGVVELESQARAFMESVATMRGDVVELEVRYQTLAQQYGPDNPQVRAAREALIAARGQIARALGGQDELMPVAIQALPALSRRYAELMQDQIIQAQIIETVYPLYEQVLFQERNEAVAVQVVDDAVPPILAARPSRRVIIVVATISVFLLAVIFVLLSAWWQRYYAGFAKRLRDAAVSKPAGA